MITNEAAAHGWKHPLITDELHELIEAVPVGVAVTFPNGVVVDKRVVLGASNNYWTAPAAPAAAVAGFRCSRCGAPVGVNGIHSCGAMI